MHAEDPGTRPETMRYTYVSAWKVIGGITMAAADAPRVLHETDQCKITLSSSPDDHLATIDKGAAAANLLLRGLFNAEKFPDPAAAIAGQMEKMRTERMGKSASVTVLVIEAFGTCEAAIGKTNEVDGIVLTFDAIDKAAIRAAQKEQIDSAKLALAFESEPPSRLEKFTEGIYITDAAERTIYSITFQMNARGYVSSRVTDEAAHRISERFIAVGSQAELRSISRLYAQMAENEDEPLKAFLFGWSALEILVAKMFVAFEEQFMSPLLGGSQTRLRERFLRRVRDVMKDKYRLVEKFTCVTVALFPDAADTDVDWYLEKFERLKRMRDKLLHGEDILQNTLPVHELSGLLRSYVLAYLDRPAA